MHWSIQADEEDLQGGIELDGDDLLFNQAIDDFIQVHHTTTLIRLAGFTSAQPGGR